MEMCTGKRLIKKGERPTTVTTCDKSSATRGFSHYVAIFFWIGWTTFYFFFTLSLPLLWIYNKPLLTAISGLIMISALLPIKRKLQPKWAYSLGEWAMHKAAEYFHMKMVVEDKEALEKSGPVIFALEPHHVLPLSIFAFNDYIRGFGGHKCMGMLTSACFKLPLMRHVYTWVNAHSIDKKEVIKLMDDDYSPVICPGGVQEVTMMESDDECVLYLKKRFGFIKLALKYGRPIVPVFAFGIENSFTWISPKGKIMAFLGRKLGFLPMAFFGLFGLPLGPSKPVDYVNVVGKPIVVPKIDNPTDEDLHKYQALFLIEITRLFETYQDEYGRKGHVLRIV